MKEGDKELYRSGLSEKQLAFIENDLKSVPQNQLVVAMMHIPLVKSTPWLAQPVVNSACWSHANTASRYPGTLIITSM